MFAQIDLKLPGVNENPCEAVKRLEVQGKTARIFWVGRRLTHGRYSSIYGNMSNYHTEIQRFAEIFRALSNTNRLQIFLRLVSCCPPGTKCNTEKAVLQCVTALGEGLDIDPSTVSHHIRELRLSGLVRTERRGKNILCWVDPDAVAAAANLLNGRMPAGIVQNDVCIGSGENSRMT